MIETFAALLFAHVLADFVLQTGWMVANKRAPAAMLSHIAVVFVTAAATIGTLHPILLGLAGAHLLIDTLKTFSGRRGLIPFLADQAAHLASLAALARLAPDLWDGGQWSGLTAAPACFALAAGLILATRAGGFAVGFLMEPWAPDMPVGLLGAGRAIGMLERGLVFILVMTGQTGAIGFLIAAKSVLRFGAVGDDRKISEYVIVGTLASFGWGIVTAILTLSLLTYLPPLGIPDLPP
ncbi:DUF3307 domain-containing protein [Frigidibacter sp. RF13]|uniref:DUF3307 domain-containing protein n=1 Tax=Frigidibacter sp. RF13 TaxID=2997340 RepID=UPI00227030F2|nr:DUF3307 domain-containing protein [Frigidibacter sp. RF13]MCY1125524.1 DUF3307 domain-containing protein [Frigidibacter sp. RF13]